MSARARRGRRSTRWAARAGPRPRPTPNGPCAMSPATCSPSRPRANRSRATPSRRTRRGSASSRAPSSSRRRPTRCAPSSRPRPTWSAPSRWTGLICGDVGFGKTEVGIRAAFKAVMDGKQVAVLVPTTVLAQQHFNTFRERMADYPIRVELLSRFRTRRAQERVVRDLAAGRRGHRDRHAPAVAERHRLQGPGPGGHRRGAALRRDAQGEVQDAAPAWWTCSRSAPRPIPAHALPGADRRARHEHHPDAAARPPARRDDRHRHTTSA